MTAYLMFMEGRVEPGAPWLPMSGRLDVLYLRDLFLFTSMLTDLVFVAKLSSNSFTSMYCYLTLLSLSPCSLVGRHTSLIFLTKGSLIYGLNPNMQLIILYLKGLPLGSMEFNLHTSRINLKEFYLTFVFLWVHHEQANSISCS